MLIICAGMIRAGSTLQYNVVRHILEHKQLGIAEGFLGLKAQAAHQFTPRKWMEDRAWHAIKVHHFGEQLKQNANSEGIRICYIYRDLRDVAVSALTKWRYGEKELFAALDDAVEVYNFVYHLPCVLMQRYEKFSIDLSQGIREIGKSLNVGMSSSEAIHLAEFYSIETTMKRTEELRDSKSFQLRMVLRVMARKVFGAKLARRLKDLLRISGVYDQKLLWHPDHISKSRGAIGVWRSELDKELCKMIIKRYGGWLERNGYLDSDGIGSK
jgi:hypothetical protein